MSHHVNLVRIKGVYHGFRELRDQIVFVGGATVSLYADRPDQSDVRPTDDIDVLIEIGTYGAYIKIQDRLNELGFTIDIESKVTCRFRYQGLTVDIMPTEEGVLGFSNIWYKAGFKNTVPYEIDEHTQINIFSAPFFIASKLEAFKGRGANDGRTSQDFEDIVFVLDNRKSLWEEMKNTELELNRYLKKEWNALNDNKYLEEWLSAHLEYQTSGARTRFILAAIADFIKS